MDHPPHSIDDTEVLGRLEAMFWRTNEPMFMGDGVDILDANRPMCTLLKLSRETVRTLHIADILVGGAEEANHLEVIRRESGSVTGETTLRLGDRKTVRVQFWSIVVPAGRGKLRAFTGITPVTRLPDYGETNAMLRALFDDSPDGKLVVDDSGHTIYANSRHLELWDLTPKDLALPFEGRWRKTATRLVAPDQFFEMQKSISSGDGDPGRSYRLEMVNGSVLEVRSVAIHRDGGDELGRSYSTRDVTAEARAERAIKQYASLLESISTNSPDAILVVDLEGKILHHNQRFLDLWRVDESYLGEPILERSRSLISRVAEHERARYMDWFQQVVLEMVTEFEAEFDMADGRIVAMRTVPLQDSAGTLVGRASYYRDVTESRRAAKELQDSETRYRTLVSSLPVGVVMQFADGRIGACNPAAEAILGLTREQLLGLTSFDPRWRCVREDGSTCPPEEHPAVVTLRTGQPCHDVVMGVHHANGLLRWLSVNSEPVMGSSGLEGTVVSFQDITDQRLAQAALIQARTAEAFNTLASGVAHKINNSLAAIVGNAYLAGRPEALPSETTDSLTEIVSAASDATALVRDLQALGGRERTALREIDLSERARHALLTLSADERQRITTTLPDGLPRVLFDPAAMEQAMLAVLRNAIEAGEAVSVSTFVEQREGPRQGSESAPKPAPAGRFLVFAVRDNGPGIDPSVAGRVFEPFATTRFVGRGLGLAATAGIMATHHSFVELESSSAGTAARLLIPLG